MALHEFQEAWDSHDSSRLRCWIDDQHPLLVAFNPAAVTYVEQFTSFAHMLAYWETSLALNRSLTRGSPIECQPMPRDGVPDCEDLEEVRGQYSNDSRWVVRSGSQQHDCVSGTAQPFRILGYASSQAQRTDAQDGSATEAKRLRVLSQARVSSTLVTDYFTHAGSWLTFYFGRVRGHWRLLAVDAIACDA